MKYVYEAFKHFVIWGVLLVLILLITGLGKREPTTLDFVILLPSLIVIPFTISLIVCKRRERLDAKKETGEIKEDGE